MIRTEKQNIARILNAAADLIEPQGAWTQGCFARHSNDNPVGPLEPEARCWCVSGAIQRASGATRWNAWNAFDAYTRKKGYRHMADFNDTATQGEVVQALRFVAKANEKMAALA